MHLIEYLRARNKACTGLYFSITRRCPLSCAHCCSASSMGSEEFPGDPFLRLVATMTSQDRPDFLLITGGEPLLRPALVRDIADRAHEVGSKVVLVSGLFFATAPEISKPIQAALDVVDHFTISMDRFHQREVPRSAVFRVAEALLRQGKDVSFQIAAWNSSDPYLLATTEAITTAFGERIPALIVPLGPMGKARDLFDKDHDEEAAADQPCNTASWPVVTYDGGIVGCCNQDVVDRPPPAHLSVGHAATDSWGTVRERILRDSALRAIRTFGPVAVARKLDPGSACTGYCATCTGLSAKPELNKTAGEMMSTATARGMELVLQSVAFDAAVLSLSGYEHWIERGHESGAPL